MQRIRVGQPLAPGVHGYEEGVHYNYTTGGHTLTVTRKNPSPLIIDAIQSGRASFALAVREEAIFILAKFGELPWVVMHYNWWINAPLMRPDPFFDLEWLSEGMCVTICLVNASSGLVAALRSVRLSREFMLVFLKMVQGQMIPPFDPWRYLQVVEQTFEQAPNRGDLFREAICFCEEVLPQALPSEAAGQRTVQ